jgi:hypothetical protein
MPLPESSLYPSEDVYPEGQATESLIFDPDDASPVEVTDDFYYIVQEFEYTPARPKTAWSESADSDGALPTHEDHYTNAEATLRIRVRPQVNKDMALELIHDLIQKGQKARRMVMEGERGLPVEWRPCDSDNVGRLYLIECDDWNMPISPNGDDFGYSANAPVFTVHMTFAPFIYGSRVSEAEITSTDPVISYTIADAVGEVRAPLRLTVTDNASTAREQVDVGLERYHYNGADLWLEGSDLSTSGHRGSLVADAAAVGGTAIELNGLFPGYQQLCGAGGLSHQGLWRMVARAKATTDEEAVELRAKWRAGAVPYTANDVVEVPGFGTAAYTNVDLGTIYVPDATADLDLVLEAKSDVVTGTTEGVRVDAIEMRPVERAVIAQGEQVITGGQTLATYDGFGHDIGSFLATTDQEFQSTAITASNDWEGAGDSDDFYILGISYLRRGGSADADIDTGRFAVVGDVLTTTTVVAGINLLHTGKTTAQETRAGVLARYVDANNWLGAFIRIRRNSGGNYAKHLTLYKRVAGTVTRLEEVSLPTDMDELDVGKEVVSGSIGLTVSGTTASVTSSPELGNANPTEQLMTTTDAVLGTTLDDGRVGIYHAATFNNSNVRFWDLTSYSTVSAATQTYAIPSGGVLTIDGSTADNGDPVYTRGAALYLDPAGSEDKTTRLSVKARDQGDGKSEALAAVTRSTKVKVSYEPAFLAFPGT